VNITKVDSPEDVPLPCGKSNANNGANLQKTCKVTLLFIKSKSLPSALPSLESKTKLAEFKSDYQVPEEYKKHSSFHYSEKGCEIYYFGIRKCPNLTKGHPNCELCESFPRHKCNTHEVITCVCGYEFGFHYNKPSPQGYYRKKS
jgi:hypothetical protein